ISLVTVGFGTVQGSTIPVREGNTVRQKQDENGNIVITRYNPELLNTAATAAGGRFIPADASDKATRVRAALRGLKTARRNVESREDHVPRFLWLLLPALALLMFDTWLMSRGSAGKAGAASRSNVLGRTPAVASERASGAGATGGSGAAVVALLLLLGVSGCQRDPDPALLLENGDIAGALAVLSRQIADGDTTAVTRYNFGSTLLAADSLSAAAELLEAVRRSADGEPRMRARFNAGLASLLIGRDTANKESAPAFAAALAAYRAYLQERPGDLDAKWNYELALRPKPPSGGGGGGGGGNDDEQPEEQEPQPQGGIDQKQAEALLNSAAREERDVQGKKQKQGRVPPNGKDW
ncbi:MAG: hypothetical protein V4617_17160, partial [Gemmatimonadota bacterium]